METASAAAVGIWAAAWNAVAWVVRGAAVGAAQRSTTTIRRSPLLSQPGGRPSAWIPELSRPPPHATTRAVLAAYQTVMRRLALALNSHTKPRISIGQSRLSAILSAATLLASQPANQPASQPVSHFSSPPATQNLEKWKN